MKEVFVIERLVADGYWELMSDKAYADEQKALEDCCYFIKELQKKDKYANARVKKLII